MRTQHRPLTELLGAQPVEQPQTRQGAHHAFVTKLAPAVAVLATEREEGLFVQRCSLGADTGAGCGGGAASCSISRGTGNSRAGGPEPAIIALGVERHMEGAGAYNMCGGAPLTGGEAGST